MNAMLKPPTLLSRFLALAALVCGAGAWAEETVPEQGTSPEARVVLPKKSNGERAAEVVDDGVVIPPPVVDRSYGADRIDRIDRTRRTETAEPVTRPANDGPDLIGDRKPVGSTAAAVQPTTVQDLLEDMPAPSPISTKARQCYRLLGEMKSNAEKISVGLDDGGKEVTLLVRMSDELGNNITDLSELWPEDDVFIDQCSIAKRQVLILNEELDRSPRNWRYLRRSLNSSLAGISKLRHTARLLADSEPKPVQMKDKDGKLVYVDREPEPLSPELARREAAVSEAKRTREMMRKQEEEREKKRKQIPMDLDGTRK